VVVRFLASGAVLLAWAAAVGARTRPREVVLLAGIKLLDLGACLGFANVALRAVPSAIVAAVIGVNPVAATGSARCCWASGSPGASHSRSRSARSASGW
jgi:hypothetical protein